MKARARRRPAKQSGRNLGVGVLHTPRFTTYVRPWEVLHQHRPRELEALKVASQSSAELMKAFVRDALRTMRSGPRQGRIRMAVLLKDTGMQCARGCARSTSGDLAVL